MRRPRLALVLGLAAAGLLASGCEYWRNLTQEIAPDQASVTLTVRDALTGEPLAGASCGKSGKEAFLANGNGVIARDDMPTGKYQLVCNALFYRTRTLAYEVRLGESRNDTIRLVRQGGDHWYPDSPNRKVRIQLLKGNTKYPGTLVATAFPEGSGEFFYQWSSNLTEVPPMSQSPVCTLRTQPSELRAQTLNLGLKVSFKPKDEAEMYLIDSTEQLISLERNRAPTIQLDTSNVSSSVGCSDEPDILGIVYDASDPDGDVGCEVHITSTDPTKPVGVIDTLVPCGREKFQFEVQPHLGAPDRPIRKHSHIKLEVQDQNGERQSTILYVETISNVPPSIEMALLHPTQTVFTTTEVQSRVTVEDYEPGVVDSVHLDWGDGNVRRVFMRFEKLPSTAIYRHNYGDTGTYTIKAKVFDGCKGVDTVVQRITVRKNSIPRFKKVEAVGVDHATGEFQLRVEIEDADVNIQSDTISVFVQWNLDGDSNDDTVFVGPPNQHFNQIIRHRYDPLRPEAEFKIRLQAFDRHEDREDASITVPKWMAVPDAPRLPPPRDP